MEGIRKVLALLTLGMLSSYPYIVAMSIVRRSSTVVNVPVRSWTTPCGPPLSSLFNIQFEQFGPYSDTEVVQNVVIMLKEGLDTLNSLNQNFISSDVLSENILTGLQNSNESLKGLPSLSSLKKKANDSTLNVTDHISDDYITLSTIVVFVEQAIKDNEEAMVNLFQLLRHKSLAALCHFQRYLKQNNRTIDIHISYDIMSQCLRNMMCGLISTENRKPSKTNLFERDYILTKESISIFSLLLKKYEKFSSGTTIV